MVVPAYRELPDATSESIPNGRLHTGAAMGFMEGGVTEEGQREDSLPGIGEKRC